MKFLPLLLVIIIGFSSCQAQTSDEKTVIFLLRHAEKNFPPYDEDPPDPNLNNAGKDRAQLLKRTLESVGITEIFSTQRKRTVQTAQPLAEQLGLDIQIYDGGELKSFSDQLRTKKGRILVSGHSNTTPEMVTHLGGDPGEPINEKTQFDRIYVLILEKGKPTTTLLLKYGANYD